MTADTMGDTVEILLVEDNPGDVRLIKEALRNGKISATLHVVPNGVEALAFVWREGQYVRAPRPDLILLDLNLPKKNGCEVLAELKASEALRTIPVIILTSSQAERDILKAYNLNANCYITKPADLDQFLRAVQAIEDFWFTIVKLPPGGS